jgi:hypothetical protein
MDKKHESRKRVFARVCAEDLRKMYGGATMTVLSEPQQRDTISEAATSEEIPDAR